MALFRVARAMIETGKSRSALYADVQRGLMVRPVPLSRMAVAFPSEELDAINKARIAGASDDQIRMLVERLHAARQEAAKGLI
jgi:prophage regulatory protein